MSIREAIEARCADGQLVRMDPLLPGAQPRVILARHELAAQIDEGATNAADPRSYRIGFLRDDFDRFSSGDIITIGYRNEQTCFMKPLKPEAEEVWELRSRDPSPGIRVFGAFAICDVFVATHMAWREDLAGWNDREWAREIRTAKAHWRQLFHPYSRHSGQSINDYISEDVVEIGSLA